MQNGYIDDQNGCAFMQNGCVDDQNVRAFMRNGSDEECPEFRDTLCS